LVWKKNYFLLGIALFAVGHILYITAFGFENSQWKVGVFLVFYAVSFWRFVTRNVKGIMVSAIGIYAFIISLMLWRAISRIDKASDLRTSWTKMCSCIGAFLFVFSDSVIAINHFVTPVWWSNQVIMSTYYMAQLMIALSVVDCQSKQRGMNLKRLMRSSSIIFKFDRFPVKRRSKTSRKHEADQHVTFVAKTASRQSIVIDDSAMESAPSTPPSLRSRNSVKKVNSDTPSIKIDKASLSCDSLTDSIRDFNRKKSDSKKSFSICTMFSKKKTEGETISRNTSKT